MYPIAAATVARTSQCTMAPTVRVGASGFQALRGSTSLLVSAVVGSRSGCQSDRTAATVQAGASGSQCSPGSTLLAAPAASDFDGQFLLLSERSYCKGLGGCEDLETDFCIRLG